MTLHPQIARVLELIGQADYPKLETLSPAEARELFALTATRLDVAPASLPGVEDRLVPGPGGDIPVRLYVAEDTDGPDPALIYFHGGGWVVGSIETHDRTCRYLAAHAGCRVVSVDYRLGPEHPFPAAVEDAWAAFNHVAANAAAFGADRLRIAVGGDSAGGNLAAVVTHLARITAGPAPCFQLLIYPGTDMTGGHPSRDELAEGYVLTRDLIGWFRNHYMGAAGDPEDPRASPLRYDDFRTLPAAHIQTAEYDPLRDEGTAYAEKLAEAGVAVEHRHYDGLIHGYFNMGGAVEPAKAALDDAVCALRAVLRDDTP